MRKEMERTKKKLKTACKQHEDNNKCAATITKWKFIFQEEMDKCLTVNKSSLCSDASKNVLARENDFIEKKKKL